MSEVWCEVSLIAPSHRTCKIWARIDLARAESLGSRPSHNPFRIIAKFNKTGCNSFSIHSTIQASIETNLEYFWDHMCLDNGNISLLKCRHISVLFFACVLFAICLAPMKWAEQSTKAYSKQSRARSTYTTHWYPPVQITRASLLRAPNREFDEKPQKN